MIKVNTLQQTKTTLTRLMIQYDIPKNNIHQFINYLDNTLTVIRIINNDSKIINYINSATVIKLRELYTHHALFKNLVNTYRGQKNN